MPSIETAAPPDAQLRFGFVADQSFVQVTRWLATEALRRWRLSALTTDDAALVVTELVSNAVAAAHGEWIEFQLSLEPSLLVVDVWDPCEKAPELTRERPGDEEIGGRGLLVVSALATWQVVRTRGRRGKSIRASLKVPTAPALRSSTA